MSKSIVDVLGVSVEIVIMFIFFSAIFPKERRITGKILVAAILTFLSMYTISYLPLDVIQRILLAWLCDIVFALAFPGSLSRKILLAFFPISINTCAEIFAGAIQIVYYDSVQLVVANEIVQYTQGVLLSKTLALLFVLVLTKSSCAYLRTVSKTTLCSAVFVLAISVLLVHCLFPLLLLADSTILHLEFLFICTAILGNNVLFFYLIYDANKKEQLNLEYIRVANAQNSQELLSRELSKKQSETNMLIHDMHNKLLSLAAYAQKQEYQKLLEQIQHFDQEIQSNKFTVTNYPELDALLLSKKSMAKQKDITLTLIIADFKITIDIFELSAIIGNLLDNAIENCQPSPETGQKDIQLVIKTNGKFLSVEVFNTINRKILIDKNQLIPTTKEDKLLHGIGLKSIRTLAEKHDGLFEIDSTDKKFSARVLLPVVDES